MLFRLEDPTHRHLPPGAHQARGRGALLGRDQVDGAPLVVRAPAPPVAAIGVPRPDFCGGGHPWIGLSGGGGANGRDGLGCVRLKQFRRREAVWCCGRMGDWLARRRRASAERRRASGRRRAQRRQKSSSRRGHGVVLSVESRCRALSAKVARLRNGLATRPIIAPDSRFVCWRPVCACHRIARHPVRQMQAGEQVRSVVMESCPAPWRPAERSGTRRSRSRDARRPRADAAGTVDKRLFRGSCWGLSAGFGSR